MNLHDWDQKAKLLQTQLTALLAHAERLRACFSEEKQIFTWQHRLPAMRNQLEKCLHYLRHLKLRKPFLSEQDKAILHWAQEFAQKGQLFYQEALSALAEEFWAVLIQRKGNSCPKVRARARSSKASSESHERLLRQQKRLASRLKSLKDRKQALEQRFWLLAALKENHQAVHRRPSVRLRGATAESLESLSPGAPIKSLLLIPASSRQLPEPRQGQTAQNPLSRLIEAVSFRDP